MNHAWGYNCNLINYSVSIHVYISPCAFVSMYVALTFMKSWPIGVFENALYYHGQLKTKSLFIVLLLNYKPLMRSNYFNNSISHWWDQFILIIQTKNTSDSSTSKMGVQLCICTPTSCNLVTGTVVPGLYAFSLVGSTVTDWAYYWSILITIHTFLKGWFACIMYQYHSLRLIK